MRITPTIYWLVVTLVPAVAMAQDCVPDSIVLGSQADVDTFQVNHGPCDSIVSGLTIRGATIANLEGLSGLREVGGGLRIENNDILATLRGLEGLETVGGGVDIWFNSSLESVDGLTNLFFVGGGLILNFLPALRNVDGLEGLVRVDGRFNIATSALSNVDGVENLIHVGGNVDVIFNENLRFCAGLIPLSDAIDHGEPGPGLVLPPDVGGIWDVDDNHAECSGYAAVLASRTERIFNDGFESGDLTAW